MSPLRHLLLHPGGYSCDFCVPHRTTWTVCHTWDHVTAPAAPGGKGRNAESDLQVETWCVALWIWGDGRKCAELWGCLTCLYSRVGEPRMQTACLPACLCKSLRVTCPLCVTCSVALAPQGGTCCGTQQGVPTCLSTRGKQSRKDANRSYATELHTAHASPLLVMGTVYRAQTQGCENTTYQAQSRLWEHGFP